MERHRWNKKPLRNTWSGKGMGTKQRVQMLDTNGEWKQFYKANNKANLQFSSIATLTMQFNIVIILDNLPKDTIPFRHMAQRPPKLELT